MTRTYYFALAAFVTLLFAPVPAHAQIWVVNMIPNSLSNETGQDSEGNLAVDPAHLMRIAGTAFTTDPSGPANTAPIYVSTDGGFHWTLNPILPSPGQTNDSSIRFSSTDGVLYSGILTLAGSGDMLVLRTTDFTSNTVMTQIDDVPGPDQPFIQAATVGSGPDAGKDRVYVGNNAASATVTFSLDASIAAPASTNLVIDNQSGVAFDAPSIRPAIHLDGTIYAAFMRWNTASVNASGETIGNVDVVVVRDDNWGTGANPFRALMTGTTLGVNVVSGRTVAFFPSHNANFGQERYGSELSIAVDPNNHDTVYVAWGDRVGTEVITLHVRRSTTAGATWEATDLITVTNAKNPSLAVNNLGKLAFLYQALETVAGVQRWVTHFRRLSGGSFDNTRLHSAPANTPTADPTVGTYLGDYTYLMAVGKDYYGIFTGNNKPDLTNDFPDVPAGNVSYLRNVDFNTTQLRNAANTANVDVSIDPFFFKSVEPAPTTLTYTGDTSADYHDPANLAATLTDQTNGLPIANAPVQFTLGSQSCTASTNAAGSASCTLVLDQCAGSYTVKANFAGSALYLSSSDSKPFTVTPEETTLSYTGDTAIANGGTATLSGVLLEDNTTPVAGRTVTFTLGSGVNAQTCSGVTNAGGVAVCTISPVAQPLGPGVVAATFAGDTCYRPGSTNANTLLFAFLASGAFVVGDQSAQMGAKVTFWGAKWSKVNSLSGGAAPASFKGFAATLSAEPPKCGITWTTGPGASSNPPATVPAYMGVLVSTKVTKSGSTISGDDKSIVVVKTDPGYASDPGHPGTGNVVAEFCHP